MKRSTSGPAGDDLQFKLLLSRSVHQQLTASAEEQGRSLSEEIRRRLEASFGVEADRPTRQLAEAIKLAAPPGWHSNARAFEVLKTAVDVLLRHLQPHGDVPSGQAAQANMDAEGAMMAGRAMGALGIQPRAGEFPSVLDMPRRREP